MAVNQVRNFVMRVGRIRLLLILMVISLGLWTVFAKLVVPAVIESAYRGESWSFFNRMIRGQAAHPVGDYLRDWDRVTIAGLLGALGFWLVVLALSSPGRIQQFPALYRGVAILALNTLVLLACLEVAAIGVFKISSVVSTPAETEDSPREKVSYYASQDWAAQFWREFKESRRIRYHPYVLYRRAPFTGQTININQDGIRLTPGTDCSAGSYRVFTFGGSPMWGTGSPDWATIAAYLQAGLERLKGGRVCVMNFGESGYVSTQGIIELLVQLESGNVPDLVLFYDGSNDVYSAYQSGRAGVHDGLDRAAIAFTGGRKRAHPLVEWIKESHAFSLLRLMVASLKPVSQTSVKFVNYETMGIDVATLSNSVIQVYLNNYKIVAALAQEYGFQYYFFWAPIIHAGNKPLTSEEQAIKLGEADPALVKLYDSTYRKMELRAPEYGNLYYMAHIFDGYRSLVWIDDTHPSPVGYRMIAQKMLEVVTKRYPLR
jgi:lysophospholipase L1-like esterase